MSISLFTQSCQCFTGDTLVSTEDGDVRIDEIRPGDTIWTNNIETGEKELQEVKSVKETKTDIIVHVITDDENEIQTTMFHPFYVKDESKETLGNWVAASNLKKGDELLTEDGKNIKVSEVRVQKHDEEITVYNLEITEVHTYYVAGGVLVHNACTDADAGGSRKNTGEGGSGVGSIPTPNSGQGFSPNGYNPQPGERTLDGYVKNHASPEISLHTDSAGFNNNNGNVGGDFKRFGAELHGGVSPHVHQPQRNVAPNGNIYGTVGTKTANGGVTSPSKKDVKQLYEYLTNGKYH